MARPSKNNDIEAYINTVIGAIVNTNALAKSTGCSLPTILNYIKTNPSRFEKAGRGRYRILAANNQTVNQTIVTSNGFEW